MSSEIPSTTNLLSAFKQAKINYTLPQSTQYLQNTAVQQYAASPVLTPQPQKDLFVSQNQEQMSAGRYKDFLQKYGGLIAGSAALVISSISIPIALKTTKNSDRKMMKILQDTVSDISEKIKNQNLEYQVKKTVQDALKEFCSKNQPPVTSKKSVLTTALLGIGTGAGIIEFLNKNIDKIKQQGYSEEEINEAKNTAVSILETPQKALDKAQNALNIAQNAENTVHAYDNRISTAVENSKYALENTGSKDKQIMSLFLEPFYGLNLMSVRDWNKKIDLTKSDKAMNIIHNQALLRLKRSADQTVNDIKAYKEKYHELTSQWALTAEYNPIKKGGLGVVPADLQDNFTKLGIDSPTFIPMYLKKNLSEFKTVTELNPQTGHNENRYIYKYDHEQYDLSKLAEITIPAYRNGKQLMEKVEFYSAEKPIANSDKTKKIIFVKNDDYFREGIYDSTPFAEETEKFAMFTKAVYTLAKYKVASALESDLTGVENISITDKKAFDDLHAPNSIISNDWHAGSIAGLLRYRAPMEYSYNELSEEVMNALKDMPLLLIGHNLGVQGNTNSGSGSLTARNQTTENVINTLYDHFAIAVARNAHSGIDGDDMCNTILMKRETGDKQFNNLFHGAALADWFEIVSENHAQECINNPSLSGMLYPLLQRRQYSGTVGGILNGLDKNKVDMKAVSEKNYVKGLKFEVYDENTPIDEVMKKRAKNKREFYRQFVKPLIIDKNYKGNIEVVNSKTGSIDISEEDFMQAPLISFAHRLSGQKGLKHFKGAIMRLFDEWNELFPDKPMPIILAGGPVEDAEQLIYLNELKNSRLGTNKNRAQRTIALKNNLPNPAIMAASTFFAAPSDYEPCGLVQGECFAKGTPVIATDVGGYHDTIIDGQTGFLAKAPNEEAVYDKLVEALNMYFNDYDKYKEMVQEDLKVDFSWKQTGKKGSVFEYTDKMGFDRENLPDITD